MDTSQHDAAQLQAQARDCIPKAQFQVAIAFKRGFGVVTDSAEEAR